MKFLHLSDLHIASHPSNNSVVETKLKYIAKKFPHHQIIITGDIIDNEGDVSSGTRVPIQLDYEGLLGLARKNTDLFDAKKHIVTAERAYRNALDLLRPFTGRLLLCPGNHDYALWGNFHDELYALGYENFAARLNQHISSDPTLSANQLFPKGQPAYHRVTDGNTDIHIIVLNSCRTTTGLAGASELATGIIGSSQRINLENMLTRLRLEQNSERKACTIVMLHHHPWFDKPILDPLSLVIPGTPPLRPTHKLMDAEQLLDVFKKHQIDYLLYGHSHGDLHHKTPVPGVLHGGLNAPAFRAAKSAYEFEALGAGPTPVSFRPTLSSIHALRIAPLLTFDYQGGYFVERDDDVWEEWKNGTKQFEFQETERDQNDIILYDLSRGIYVALPHDSIQGMARFRYDGEETWKTLFNVKQTSQDDHTGEDSDDVVPGVFGRWPG